MTEFTSLLGVALGGLLTWGAMWQTQRARDEWGRRDALRSAEREDQLRVGERRWEVYVRFLTNANVLYSRVRRPGLTLHPDEWQAEVYEAMLDLDASMSAAFLVTSDEGVRHSISRVVKTSRELALGARSNVEDLADLLHAHREAVIAAEQGIRNEIDVRKQNGADMDE